LIQSIGIINIVLIIETGMLIINKSFEVRVYELLSFLTYLFKISEDARKLDQENPCLNNKAINPVYRSLNRKFLS